MNGITYQNRHYPKGRLNDASKYSVVIFEMLRLLSLACALIVAGVVSLSEPELKKLISSIDGTSEEALKEPMSWIKSSCDGHRVPQWLREVLPPHAVKVDPAPCRRRAARNDTFALCLTEHRLLPITGERRTS